MRVFLLAFIILCCTTLRVQAQDVILRRDGDEIKAQVLAITPTEISYVPSAEPPNSDTLYMAAKEVFLIRYANGTRVVLNNGSASTPKTTSGRTAEEMTNQGRMDAQKYFKAPGSLFATASATTIGLALLGPTALGAISGVGTGTLIAVSPIQNQNIVVPDTALLSDANYLLGYQKQAQRKKLGKAAGGFGIGFVAGTAIWFAIALSNTRHF